MTEEGFTPASRVVELFDGTAPGLTQSGGSTTGPVYVAGARYESLEDMQEALERGGPAGVIQAGGSRRGAFSKHRRTHKGRRRFPRRLRRTKRRNSRRARR